MARTKRDRLLSEAATSAVRSIGAATMESLESRDYRTVNWYPGIGLLQLAGTDASDYFEIRMTSPTQFEVRTAPGIAGTRTWSLASVVSVQAKLGGFGDELRTTPYISGGATFQFNKPMEVYGDDVMGPSVSGGGDTIVTGAGKDYIVGQGCGDIINAGDGDDVIYGYFSTYVYTGSVDDWDIIDGGNGIDQIHGGPDNDTICGGAGTDSIWGDEFDDDIYGDSSAGGSTGNDTIWGGADDDKIWGQGGIDSLLGEGGDDRIDGGNGDDVISGSEGVDHIAGSFGNDVIDGGNSDDFIWGASIGTDEIGDDVIEGGGGHDDIYAGAGDDTVHAGSGDDYVEGGSGADRLHGEGDTDELCGGDGEDSLFAGSGNDELNGGNDDDLLVSIDDDALDDLNGDGGFDSFWIDKVPTSTPPLTTTDNTDADSEEDETNVHKVEEFENGADLSLDGDNLADPALEPGVTNPLRNYADRPLFGSAGPGLTDVRQGDVGDCWLMGTLGAAARVNQNVVRQLVADLGDGTFAVQIEQKQYRVDADLAYAGSAERELYYADLGHDDSLWVAIVEKAWALYRDGTYDSLNNDNAYFAMGHIGGESRALWNVLGNASTVLAAVDSPSLAAVAFSKLDAGDCDVLTEGHAFVITDYDSAADEVQLYNPYGKFITVTVDEFEHDVQDIGGVTSAEFNRFNPY